MFNLFLIVFIWFGCSDKDGNSSNSTSNVVQPVAKGTEFADLAATANNRGVTDNVAENSGTILERHKNIGKTPENAIALWIEAAVRAQNGDAEGWAALSELTLPLRGENGWQSQGRHTYFVKAINENNPAFRSFIVGSSPENNYDVDLKNIRIRIAYENTRDTRGRKFMLVSSGSTMPRPIYIQKSNQTGLFYINEYSSMYVDVRPAVDPDKETFE